MTSSIFDLTQTEYVNLFESLGEPKYRGLQFWEGLYHHLWAESDEFTSFSKSLRQNIGKRLNFHVLFPEIVLHSKDGKTEKILFRLDDGQAIETVLMKYDQRNTICISTQVGCGMGCAFCATGQMGYKRNLTSGEIVAQVMHYARKLYRQNAMVTNVVFMGMGEPFHNYDNTIAAIDRLNDPLGYNFGARRMTISTVGLIPAIKRFTAEKRQVNLAISLHAADDKLRSSLIPINKTYPINELLSACREYYVATKRRITFEWALIRDVNDHLAQASLLGQLLSGFPCHVNVIPLNPINGYSGQRSSRERADMFKSELSRFGVACTIRVRRGIEINAGCGQLVVKQ